jgi:5-amino-6-(5-phosphoribosylamino)uracil reductase
MSERPYTILSCCMSIDGYLGTGTQQRLMLSNDTDFDRVDSVRASCDAILVGASTIRADDPRLLVRSLARRQRRVERGLAPSPSKVTVTRTAWLDPSARFFTEGDADKLVYCAADTVAAARTRLGSAATVIDGGAHVDMFRLSQDLRARGVRRLMVEGGSTLLTAFLTASLADELQLAVAPFFVGDPAARRLVSDGRFPWNQDRRARLAEARPVGDVVLMRYALSDRFETDAENLIDGSAASHLVPVAH